MKLQILFVAVVLAIAFLVSLTGLGDGGFITTFLVSFGLIVIIGLLVLVSMSRKAKKQNNK